MNSSPFGGLPAEIRNHIYDLALSADDPVGAHALTPPSSTRRGTYHFEHALARTCSQMRQEVKPMFYARTTFAITIRHRQYDKLSTRLDLVGPEHLRLVKGLIVQLREREILMLLALGEVMDLLGPKGIRFKVERVGLGYEKQPGRREKGHGRYKKWQRGLPKHLK